jgi:hypothetical protein
MRHAPLALALARGLARWLARRWVARCCCWHHWRRWPLAAGCCLLPGAWRRRRRRRRRLVATPRGRQKTPDGPPRTFAKSQTHPPAIRLVFSLAFFLGTFLGVSRQGEFKNTTKIFLQKVHVENFPQKNRGKNRCQFSSIFLFYSFFGCFSAMGVQKHNKKGFTKEIVSKSFYKKIDKKSKTDCFSVFL